MQVEGEVACDLRGAFYALGGHDGEDGEGIAAGFVVEAEPFLHGPGGAADVVHGVAEFGEDAGVEFAGIYESFELMEFAGGGFQASGDGLRWLPAASFSGAVIEYSPRGWARCGNQTTVQGGGKTRK